MIHRSDNLKTAAICCGDHQAAASATPVIFAGIDAGHRIPAARAVGSPGPRRSLVLLKPAIQG